MLQVQLRSLCGKKETLNEVPATSLPSVSQIQHSSVRHGSGEQYNSSVVRGLNEQVGFLESCFTMLNCKHACSRYAPWQLVLRMMRYSKFHHITGPTQHACLSMSIYVLALCMYFLWLIFYLHFLLVNDIFFMLFYPFSLGPWAWSPRFFLPSALPYPFHCYQCFWRTSECLDNTCLKNIPRQGQISHLQRRGQAIYKESFCIWSIRSWLLPRGIWC